MSQSQDQTTYTSGILNDILSLPDHDFEEAYNTNTDGQKGCLHNMCDVLDKRDAAAHLAPLLRRNVFRSQPVKRHSGNELYSKSQDSSSDRNNFSRGGGYRKPVALRKSV